MSTTRPLRRRRGTALVAILGMLAIVQFVVIAVVLGGARDQDLTVRRLDSVRAFYAAEAGMNMAIREVMLDEDEDGDGEIGTISDDGSDADDPQLGVARVIVTRDVVDETTTLTSKGRSGLARRHLEAEIE